MFYVKFPCGNIGEDVTEIFKTEKEAKTLGVELANKGFSRVEIGEIVIVDNKETYEWIEVCRNTRRK